MVVLVDTNVLVALVDSGDDLHALASKELGRLARAELRVTSAVLCEACFLLPRPDQRGRLFMLIDRLPISPAVDDETTLRREVFAWLEKYAEHEPDYADGELCVLFGKTKRSRIWTYDSEFTTTWRTPAGRKPAVIGKRA